MLSISRSKIVNYDGNNIVEPFSLTHHWLDSVDTLTEDDVKSFLGEEWYISNIVSGSIVEFANTKDENLIALKCNTEEVKSSPFFRTMEGRHQRRLKKHSRLMGEI